MGATEPAGTKPGSVTVVSEQQGTAAIEQALRRLWDRAATRGWLPAADERVAVQVDRTGGGTLSTETAESLIAYLRSSGSRRVDLVDSVSAATGPEGAPLAVAGIAARRPLQVPTMWFDDAFLVTVAEAARHALARVAGVLEAQAALLQRLGNAERPATLVYEAHRLGAPDLAVVCGRVDARDPRSEAWWIASPSDLAVDVALARASGVAPEGLPNVRALARHEVLPERIDVDGSLPRLNGFVGGEVPARARAALWAARTFLQDVARDVVVIRRNAGKIPHYVRRQLAAHGREGR